jgi:hypothetical protein
MKPLYVVLDLYARHRIFRHPPPLKLSLYDIDRFRGSKFEYCTVCSKEKWRGLCTRGLQFYTFLDFQ